MGETSSPTAGGTSADRITNLRTGEPSKDAFSTQAEEHPARGSEGELGCQVTPLIWGGFLAEVVDVSFLAGRPSRATPGRGHRAREVMYQPHQGVKLNVGNN